MEAKNIDSGIDTSCQNATNAKDMAITIKEWDEVGISDIAVSPENDLLVERNFALLEGCIVRLMAWREEKLGNVFGTPSAGYVKSSTASSTRQKGSILPEPVYSELLEFVNTIASMYNDVLYHYFDHTSHILLSLVWLLIQWNFH